jgi:hypothetical protein
MNSKLKNFAVSTRQGWKYRVFQLLFLVWIVAGLASLSRFLGNPLDLSGYGPLDSLAVIFMLLSLVWYAAAVRCPKCKKSPMWYQITHTSVFDSKTGFESTGVCPICHSDPAGAQIQHE